MHTLKVLHIAQTKVNKFIQTFLEPNEGKTITFEKLAQALREHGIRFEDTDLLTLLENITSFRNKGEDLNSLAVPIEELKFKLFAYYVENTTLNHNPIIKQLSGLPAEELQNVEMLSGRLFKILDASKSFKLPVLSDAEQTYIQGGIDALTQQFQSIYNKDDVLVYNTFQNYLKSTQKRVKTEVQRCQLLNEPLAVKMVRGAYMVEENGIAKKKGEESPIHSTYEDTEINYHENIQYCLERMTPTSRFMLASHNERSIRMVKEFIGQRKADEWLRSNVQFAQLCGFADHMSYSLMAEGYKVSKYLPFGELDIMIPYLVRRAQESKQMFSSATLQATLMKHEMSKRWNIFAV